MILSYWKSKNFGDALNPFLFPTLLPSFFDDDPTIKFVGIGSILGQSYAMPETTTRKLLVFGTGYAYGRVPVLDERYDILCVRGPLTARSLGLGPEKAVTDGALLIASMGFKKDNTQYPYAFMPHHTSSELCPDWQLLCTNSGIHYIDPELEVESVLQQIRQSGVLFAEAMHGAIVADALRIPWIPIVTGSRINRFKWQDWCMSMELPYSPYGVPMPFSSQSFKLRLKYSKKLGYIGRLIANPASTIYKPFRRCIVFPQVERCFSRLKRHTTFLSSDQVHRTRLEQLNEILYCVRNRY